MPKTHCQNNGRLDGGLLEIKTSRFLHGLRYRNEVMMKGSKKQKTVGQNKPSQASLVSRGLAVKPSLTRYVDGKTSDPPSVRSGYSLYSSDSESTAGEVNQGLNRCAKLLANILDTNDHGHSIKTGLATYRHQGQKSKTNAKPHRSHPSKPDPKPLKNSQKNPVPERKSTRASQTKKHHSKTSKRKDAVTSTVSVLPEAKQGRREASESKRSVSSTVHVIPTGTDDSGDKPVAGPSTAHKAPTITRNIKHLTAPGFQDHLMSSTPAERESPKKPQGLTATPNQTPKPPSPSRGIQPTTLAKPLSGPRNHPVTSRRDHDDTNLRNKSPTGLTYSPRERNAPVDKTEGFVGDIAVESMQKPEPGKDWMQWYDESVAKQTMYEGLARAPKSPSSHERESGHDEAPTKPERDAHRGISGSVVPARHPMRQPLPQPLTDSEDLLRDLVQQLTILNQSDKSSVPLGKTEQVLQGLIQNRQHAPSKDISEEAKEANIQPMTTDTGPPPYAGRHYHNQQSSQLDREQPSLRQLLSDFRQTPSRQTPRSMRRDDNTPTFTSVAPPFNGGVTFKNRHPTEMTDLQPTKDTQKSQAEVPDSLSSPQEAFVTPKKAPLRNDFEDDTSNYVSTPFVHHGGYNVPDPEQEKYIQVGKPAAHVPTSPPQSSEPLTVDHRGQTLKQSCLQQIRTLKYLLGELQAVLADHEDIEVSRLLNELEEVCNTLPYTTRKQLLDLNTEVLLALQPLQSENGQLRRRLRIANHQLQSREMAEKKDEGSMSLEAMALQALNSNLQKQLRQERQEKEQMVKNNLEMSQSLEEKEQQHQNMLRILNDKDSNLLKTRQETLAELQDLREARSELQSKVDYLELQVEGASKETRILQLSLEQRDNEIARLKSFNQSLQEQISKLRSQQGEDPTSPKTSGGIGLQRMSRLLMERSPNKANKENIQSSSYHSGSTPRKHLQSAKKSHDPSVSNSVSHNHARGFRNSLTKSPKQRVTFLDTHTHNQRGQDISEWARTDTLWKDQQELPGDLISFEVEGIKPFPKHDSSGAHVSVSPDRPSFSPTRGSTTPNLISDTLRQDTTNAGENRFRDKMTFENRMSPYHLDLDIPEPAFGKDSRPVIDVNPAMPEPRTEGNSYRATWDVASKPAIASVISDSTVSSITTEYEAQFQSGLRDLDAEIGKLQASLKYSAFKPL
ncbi:uncharacterized protein LOC119722670 [Patiria miniata]|uniref:Coiled-coil domain-containing protein 14 n=1 Tax=Patiria miniata TaxID=46514 RepID=A0A913ZD30_PATMI|nr:uncharacterized protein LOC119722670 [Patiria miniata]